MIRETPAPWTARELLEVLVLAAFLMAFACRCGGDAFGTMAPAADAGELLDVDAGELHDVDAQLEAAADVAGDDQADAGELLEAAVDAHADVAQLEAAVDAGAVDAQLEAAVDAGGGLCCRIACGTGTIHTGWTCAAPCGLGSTCSYQSACGLVVACQ